MRDVQALAHFETLYARSDDPWDVRGAWYEQRKRAILLASLGKPRYRSAFEPGCGNGEMSLALADRCERLLACDGAASALEAARRRVPDAATRGIRFEARRLPTDWPRDDTFDLVVLSELAYYFDEDAITAMLTGAAANLATDGELVLCHYLHDFDDRVTSTATVHGIADALPGLRRSLHHRDEAFVLDIWRPTASTQGERV